MAHEVYAIEHHDLTTNVRTLLDHMLGEKERMEIDYVKPWNRTAKRKKWNVHYRIVPMPFAHSLPEWFEYTMPRTTYAVQRARVAAQPVLPLREQVKRFSKR